MKKTVLMSFAAAMLLSGTLTASEYHVKLNGSDNNSGSATAPFQTVEKAIEVVKENVETTIYLEENAVFKIGKLDLLNNKQVAIIGKNTTLKAHDKPGKEQGEGNRILRANTGCNLKIKGITFENGRQVGYILGGAIFFAGDKMEIDSCRFINNEAGSSGGAIGARGRSVIIKNSYFEGNYTIGGGAIGGAIMQAGVPGVSNCSLRVENCTFHKNNMSMGGQGTAIGIFDKSEASVGGSFTNLSVMEIVNCTFTENSSSNGYQAAIDVSSNKKIKAYMINNTFYNNDGALRIGDILGGKVVMINNLIFANKAAIFGDLNVYTDDRDQIIAYNNILSGVERGVNEFIDDDCFNSKKGECNNIVETTSNYPLSKVSLSTAYLSDGSFVPYLAINSATSEAVNKGLDDSSTQIDGVNMVPNTDIRGKAKDGIRDIGAYEYNGQNVAIFTMEDEGPDLFELTQLEGAIRIKSLTEATTQLRVMDISGRTILNTTLTEELSIDKSVLNRGLMLFVFNNGTQQKTQKVLVF